MIGYGGTPYSEILPNNQRALALFRRTDILGPPVRRTPPPPPKVPVPPAMSSTWQACLVKGAGADIPGIDKVLKIPLGVDTFQMVIRDIQNSMEMRYQYKGFSIGLGLPFGISSGGDCLSFTTSLPVRLTDFEGFARHTSAQLQVSAGPSVDYVHLLGPYAQRGADTVYLVYGSFETTVGQTKFGANAGTSVGTFEPLGPATPF